MISSTKFLLFVFLLPLIVLNSLWNSLSDRGGLSSTNSSEEVRNGRRETGNVQEHERPPSKEKEHAVTLRPTAGELQGESLMKKKKSPISFESMAKKGSELGRAFQPHNNWCHKNISIKKKGNKSLSLSRKKGLLYVKVPKSGSSTVASVVLRIGNNNGNCHNWVDHTYINDRPGTLQYYKDRIKKDSFLIGSVRDPASRAVSRIFMRQVSIYKNEPTDTNVLEWLQNDEIHHGCISKGQGGFQLHYMTLREIPYYSAYDENHDTTSTQVKNITQVQENVAQVIKDYDFMVVSERMDESIVVLGMLLGVETGDLLTFDSKISGSNSWFHSTKGNCFQLHKGFQSPAVENYLKSDTWRAQNYGDYLLHSAASASLDRTIDKLGPDKVKAKMEELNQLRTQINEACKDEVVLPCSPSGEPQAKLAAKNCYFRDLGCGYPCIDKFLKDQRKKKQE